MPSGSTKVPEWSQGTRRGEQGSPPGHEPCNAKLLCCIGSYNLLWGIGFKMEHLDWVCDVPSRGFAFHRVWATSQGMLSSIRPKARTHAQYTPGPGVSDLEPLKRAEVLLRVGLCFSGTFAS